MTDNVEMVTVEIQVPKADVELEVTQREAVMNPPFTYSEGEEVTIRSTKDKPSKYGKIVAVIDNGVSGYSYEVTYQTRDVFTEAELDKTK